MRVLIIGLTKELPLSPFDAMDIADKLVARAANAHSSGMYVCMSSNQFMLKYKSFFCKICNQHNKYHLIVMQLYWCVPYIPVLKPGSHGLK